MAVTSDQTESPPRFGLFWGGTGQLARYDATPAEYPAGVVPWTWSSGQGRMGPSLIADTEALPVNWLSP